MAKIRLSATALDDFIGPDDGCERKWHMGRTLPYAPPEKAPLGVVGHAILDRWLSADERGVDPETGQEVNLYPEGWAEAKDRWGNYEGKITPVECESLQVLIDTATKKGLVARVPHRKIEEEISLVYHTPSGNRLEITGYRDVTVHPPAGGKLAEVWDHKFHAKMKSAKSARKLFTTPQMRLYALDLFEKYPTLEGVLLRHIQFCTDPEKLSVRVVDGQNPLTGSAVFTREEAMAFKRVLLDAADRMILYRDNAKHFSQVPITSKGGWVCMKCPFMYPCAGQESEPAYINRIQQWAAEQGVELRNNRQSFVLPGLSDPDGSLSSPQQEPPGTPEGNKGEQATMSAFASLMSASMARPAQAAAPAAAPMNFAPPAPAAAAPSPAPVPTPAPPPPPPPAAVSVATVGGPTPPWTESALKHAQSKKPCNACKGLGWNSKGMPCGICVAFSAPECQPHNYIIEHTPGGIVWEQKPGGASAPTPAPTPAPPPAPAQAAPNFMTSVAPTPLATADEMVKMMGGVDPFGGAQKGQNPLPVQPVTPTVQAAPAPVTPLAQPTAAQTQQVADAANRAMASTMQAAAQNDAARVANGQAPATQQFVQDVANGEFVDPTQGTQPAVPAGTGPASQAPKNKGGRPRKNQEPTVAQVTEPEGPAIDVIGFADAVKQDGPTDKGYWLLINQHVQGPPPAGYEFAFIEDLFTQFTSALAQRNKVSSYYHLNTWRRREALAGAISGILPLLEGKVLVGRVDDPDLRYFATGLRRFAKFSGEGYSAN